MRREGEAAAIKASCAAEGQSRPVFTTESACQDCYKCVRHCHCKAIQIIDARAAILPNRCVSCGECVRVCPSHAKKIRSDLARAQRLVALIWRALSGWSPWGSRFTPRSRRVFPGTIAASRSTGWRAL